MFNSIEHLLCLFVICCNYAANVAVLCSQKDYLFIPNRLRGYLRLVFSFVVYYIVYANV